MIIDSIQYRILSKVAVEDSIEENVEERSLTLKTHMKRSLSLVLNGVILIVLESMLWAWSVVS